MTHHHNFSNQRTACMPAYNLDIYQIGCLKKNLHLNTWCFFLLFTYYEIIYLLVIFEVQYPDEETLPKNIFSFLPWLFGNL